MKFLNVIKIYTLKVKLLFLNSAQKEGFLSEAHSEEVDQADPFYAHCKLHSDKTLVKRRKRNYMALQLRTHYRKYQFSQAGHKDTPEQLRIKRKLEKQKGHYLSYKGMKPPPWGKLFKMYTCDRFFKFYNIILSFVIN